MTDKEASAIGMRDSTGGFFLLNKKERTLVRQILSMTLQSEQGKEYILKKFGGEFLNIGEKFLIKIGG